MTQHISDKYIVVEPLPKEEKEGFSTVEVQDSFIYKGKVVQVPAMPAYVGSYKVKVGDIVVWAKYSPETHDMEEDGKKVKYVAISDVLKAYE